jgi:hypothetical protein
MMTAKNAVCPNCRGSLLDRDAPHYDELVKIAYKLFPKPLASDIVLHRSSMLRYRNPIYTRFFHQRHGRADIDWRNPFWAADDYSEFALNAVAWPGDPVHDFVARIGGRWPLLGQQIVLRLGDHGEIPAVFDHFIGFDAWPTPSMRFLVHLNTSLISDENDQDVEYMTVPS